MNLLIRHGGIFILLLILTACGQQGTPTIAPSNLDLSVRVEPEPLTIGDTTLIVTLKDANGAPVDGAELRVHGDMDHQGMTPIDREVSESAAGEYRVPFAWTMGGGWLVTVTARLPSGGEISETFDFFVEAVSSESIINRASSTNSPAVNIAYQSDNDPARLGDAVVTITLMDVNGDPITDATVEVTGDMAHAGMMSITGTGEHTGNGHYVVPLRWTMVGGWIVRVSVTLADGSQAEQTFDQEVRIQ